MLQYITNFMAWTCLTFIIVLIVIVPAVANTHPSAAWVFGSWDSEFARLQANPGGGGGLGPSFTPAYGAMLGLLFAAYTFTVRARRREPACGQPFSLRRAPSQGYDGTTHLSEEMVDAGRNSAKGVMTAFVSSAVSGWLLAIALCFAIPTQGALGGTHSALVGYNSVCTLLFDAFQGRYHKGHIGTAVFSLPIIGSFLCCISITTYVSRIMFAYSRDKALPLSHLWVKTHPVTGIPINAVWGTVGLAILIGLLWLRSSFAINAILSLAVIALNVAYVTPCILRCTVGRKRFRPGPTYNLGWFAYVACAIATFWVGFAVVIFSLPQVYPGEKARFGALRASSLTRLDSYLHELELERALLGRHVLSLSSLLVLAGEARCQAVVCVRLPLQPPPPPPPPLSASAAAAPLRRRRRRRRRLFAALLFIFRRPSHSRPSLSSGPSNEVHIQNWIASRNTDKEPDSEKQAVPAEAAVELAAL